MVATHGADGSPLELKISTARPPYLPPDLWSKQRAILLGSRAGNQLCGYTP